MTNEKRLIDANELLGKVDISKFLNPHGALSVRINHRHEHDHFTKMICDAPTVDAVEVVHGRLELIEKAGVDYWRCSACQEIVADYYYKPKYNYCSNCGAKMDEEATEQPEV